MKRENLNLIAIAAIAILCAFATKEKRDLFNIKIGGIYKSGSPIPTRDASIAAFYFDGSQILVSEAGQFRFTGWFKQQQEHVTAGSHVP